MIVGVRTLSDKCNELLSIIVDGFPCASLSSKRNLAVQWMLGRVMLVFSVTITTLGEQSDVSRPKISWGMVETCPCPFWGVGFENFNLKNSVEINHIVVSVKSAQF